MELISDLLFKGEFSKLERKTKKKVKRGDIPINGFTENRLIRDNARASEFIALRRELKNDEDRLWEEKQGNINVEEFNLFHLETALKVFSDGGREPSPELLNALNYFETLTELSLKISQWYKNDEFEEIEKHLAHTPPFEEYWEGVSFDDIRNDDGVHLIKNTLRLRGFLYQLALVEALVLTSYFENPSSQIVTALIRATHCDEKRNPMQRFVLALAFYPEKGNRPTIKEIACKIGLRKLEIDLQNGEASSDDRELFEAINGPDKPTAKAAQGALKKKEESWRIKFHNALKPTKTNSKRKRVVNIYPAHEAKFMLDELILKKPNSGDFPIDVYWVVFLAARAFNNLWGEYEIEKGTNHILQQILPEGVSSFLNFYETAFNHAIKVIAGNAR